YAKTSSDIAGHSSGSAPLEANKGNRQTIARMARKRSKPKKKSSRSQPSPPSVASALSSSNGAHVGPDDIEVSDIIAIDIDLSEVDDEPLSQASRRDP